MVNGHVTETNSVAHCTVRCGSLNNSSGLEISLRWDLQDLKVCGNNDRSSLGQFNQKVARNQAIVRIVRHCFKLYLYQKNL